MNVKDVMGDPYLDGLEDDFQKYSSQLKRLKTRLLKADSVQSQARVIRQIDAIAKKMENNQRQSVKVKRSRVREKKSKSRS